MGDNSEQKNSSRKIARISLLFWKEDFNLNRIYSSEDCISPSLPFSHKNAVNTFKYMLPEYECIKNITIYY